MGASGGDHSRRGVAWGLGVSPEVLTEYAGTTLHGFYTDPEVMLFTQQEANRRFRALYGVDATALHIAAPAYVGVSALGAEVVFPEHDAPMVRNQGHVLPGRDAVFALTVPEPSTVPLMQRSVAMRPHFAEATGQVVPLSSGQEGPLTAAVLLRGERFFVDVYEDPAAAHRLLDVVTDTYIAFTRYARALNGTTVAATGLADDFAGMLRPALWTEFVLPYWRRIFEALGPGRRSVHSELLHREHLPLLVDLGVDFFDPGVDQYLTSATIAAAVAIPFMAYIWPVRDLLLGGPEVVRRQYAAEVAAGVSQVVADVSSPGIPPDSIRAFIEVARQHE
ncbi:MAG: uroporphyrinogen decarboxylase family protein [Anaerolineae bacterium]